jgi:hypothetical protein
VRLNIVADRPELLTAATAEQIEQHRELVRQADRPLRRAALQPLRLPAGAHRPDGRHRSGAPPLLRERHRSGILPRLEQPTRPNRNLLPHEYNHSWDGKFRRPADLWTPNFNVPMRDSLLWVYEGQDQYWGYVLGARSASSPGNRRWTRWP